MVFFPDLLKIPHLIQGDRTGNNNAHMSTNKTSRTLFIGITVIALATVLFILWRQQSELARIRTENSRLQKQNLALLDVSLQPQPASPIPIPAAPAAPAQPPAPTKQKKVTTSPIPPPSAHDRNLLVFSSTDVHQTTNGLVATLRFKPSKTGPLGLMLMSVRLPPDLEGKIQTIQSTGSATFEDSEWSVADNGRYAEFHGTLGDEKEVAIALGVSEPTRLFIKGTCGIPGMQLDIHPTNAVVTPFGR